MVTNPLGRWNQSIDELGMFSHFRGIVGVIKALSLIGNALAAHQIPPEQLT
jgi:hypothetical protein